MEIDPIASKHVDLPRRDRETPMLRLYGYAVRAWKRVVVDRSVAVSR